MTDLSPERVAELERRALKRATALRDAAQGAVGERRACLETDADLLDALANALPALLAERERLRAAGERVMVESERTDACVTSDSGLPETGSESCRSCAGTGIVWPSPVPVPTTKGSE